jgi:DNA-binding NarL/FixJ family response regulator
VIRVVIVDDHEMVREGLRAILTADSDFDVVGEAASAERLDELVDATRPDVVLLDARLPGISGPDACRRLTVSHPEVAVLIVSTYSDEGLVDECIRAGARGYVVKDIERFSLKQGIRAVHRGEGIIAPAVARPLLERLRTQPVGADRGQPELSSSQLEVLRLMADGLSNKEIAVQVHLSEHTVKSHTQEIFQKLEVRNRVQAALLASRSGLI